jgi:acetyl-CoA carboxylase biotin carboxyl carrier protein
MTPPKSRADRVAPLAAAFAASDLTRLAITDGEFSLEMVRRAVPPQPAASAQDTALAVAPEAIASAPTPVVAGADRQTIRAELVGTLRFGQPHPAVGTKFERDREMFSIEALGLHTPVSSGGKGTIVELLVSDGSPVEYGQPLVVIERV